MRSSSRYSFECLLPLAAIFLLVGFGSYQQAASPSLNQTESQAVAPRVGPTFHAPTRVVNSEPTAKTIRSLALDTYTNRPEDLGGVPPSVAMILLDSLNTELADQAFARKRASAKF